MKQVFFLFLFSVSFLLQGQDSLIDTDAIALSTRQYAEDVEKNESLSELIIEGDNFARYYRVNYSSKELYRIKYSKIGTGAILFQELFPSTLVLIVLPLKMRFPRKTCSTKKKKRLFKANVQDILSKHAFSR